MNSYEALLEDEDDIFGGTPMSKYWDIVNSTHEDYVKDEFDAVVERIAAMEMLLSKAHESETLDRFIQAHCLENRAEIDTLKKSVYMELAGKLIYRAAQ